MVKLDDGTEVPYSNEMFGSGTQAVISTVGNLARSELTLPQFLYSLSLSCFLLCFNMHIIAY